MTTRNGPVVYYTEDHIGQVLRAAESHTRGPLSPSAYAAYCRDAEARPAPPVDQETGRRRPGPDAAGPLPSLSTLTLRYRRLGLTWTEYLASHGVRTDGIETRPRHSGRTTTAAAVAAVAAYVGECNDNWSAPSTTGYQTWAQAHRAPTLTTVLTATRRKWADLVYADHWAVAEPTGDESGTPS